MNTGILSMSKFWRVAIGASAAVGFVGKQYYDRQQFRPRFKAAVQCRDVATLKKMADSRLKETLTAQDWRLLRTEAARTNDVETLEAVVHAWKFSDLADYSSPIGARELAWIVHHGNEAALNLCFRHRMSAFSSEDEKELWPKVASRLDAVSWYEMLKPHTKRSWDGDWTRRRVVDACCAGNDRLFAHLMKECAVDQRKPAYLSMLKQIRDAVISQGSVKAVQFIDTHPVCQYQSTEADASPNALHEAAYQAWRTKVHSAARNLGTSVSDKDIKERWTGDNKAALFVFNTTTTEQMIQAVIFKRLDMFEYLASKATEDQLTAVGPQVLKRAMDGKDRQMVQAIVQKCPKLREDPKTVDTIVACKFE